MLDVLFQDPIMFLLIVVALILSISVHEFSHALAADKLGDSTARLLGRVTLDPRKHLDPVGSLMLVVAGFGWGRPVPFNSINLSNPRRDAALIAFAGPMSNFVLATALYVVFRVLPEGVLSYSLFSSLNVAFVLIFLLKTNILLGVFNLLPLHPLDGFKVVHGALPFNLAIQWQETARWGIFVLLFLVLTGTLSSIIGPLVNLFVGFLGLF